MILRIILWLTDNNHKWHKLVTALTLTSLISGMIIFAGIKFIGYANIQHKPATLQNDTSQNRKYFDLLYQKQSKLSDGTYSMTYDLYLKQPFINDTTLGSSIQQFVDTVKEKYNGQTNKVRSIGIRLYDRKIVWDMGLTPRMIYQYSIDPSILDSENSSSDDSAAQAIKDAGGDPNDITSGMVTPPLQQSWNSTNDTDRPINYNNYMMLSSGTSTYDKSNTPHPLSDKEFAFWLKIKLYQTILNNGQFNNNPSTDNAVALYLNYDLNGQVNQRSLRTIQLDFENFDNRESQIGDNTNYFPNIVLLRQQLAIYRPQFLYFASSGKMIKSYTEAQNALIKQDSSLAQVIRDHDLAAAKNVDKYGRINYYQSKVDGKWINTDPFISTMGKYQTEFPTISRSDYSPTLYGNNAFYAQQFFPGLGS